jgi:adenine-specific DNA-methyltransferase
MKLMLPKTQIASEYSSDAEIVLFHGDVKNLLSTLPDNFVRLIITSPPYNLGKEYETRTALKTYLNIQKEIIKELIRVLAEDGSVCWQVGNFVEKGEVFPLDIYYYDIFKDLGLSLRNRIIWHFGHGLHAQKRFSGRYETLLWFTKSDEYVFNLDEVRVPSKYPGKRHYKGPNKGKLSGNPKGKNPSDFWEDIVTQEWEAGVIDIPNVKSNHPEKTVHPCQYPIELIERCVLSMTNKGDWVFDPFSGVGSSLLAAIRRNRRAIGAEKENDYINITKERVDQHFSGTLRVRPLGKKVYQPTGKEKIAQLPMEWVNEEGNNQ